MFPERRQTSRKRFHSGLRHGVVFLLALCMGTVAWALSSPDLRSHDDGIYLATAQSLIERGEYRLINLPSEPLQTKYPPLYSTLLAMALVLVHKPVPLALHALKGVNALALFLIILLIHITCVRLRAHFSAMGGLMAVVLIASAPALVSFVDFFASDLWFTALFVGLLAASSATRRPLGSALGVGVLVGLLTLSRSIGIALAGGLVWHLWKSKGVGVAAVAGGGFSAIAGPWLLRSALITPPSLLERYYVQYERSAWTLLTSDPSLAVRILLTNSRLYVASFSYVLGWSTLWLTAGASLLAAFGAWRLRHTEWLGLAIRTSLIYLLVLVGHPYPMERYLIPLVPIVIICVVAGWEWLRRDAGWSPRFMAGSLLVVAIFTSHLMWLRNYGQVARHGVHGGFGRPLAIRLSGMKEVTSWILRSTEKTNILAAANDTMYFIQTGRRAIRPWPQEAEVYVPGYGRYLSSTTTGQAVQTDLDRLCATVLVDEPLLVGGESEYARRLLGSLVESRLSPWLPAFRTSDGLTMIYRRRSTSPCVAKSPGP